MLGAFRFIIIVMLGVLGFIPTAHAADITTGLLGYWNFDETSGPTAADSSGYARDGSITGVGFTSGQFGGAFDFNSNGDQVAVPNTGNVFSINTFTLAAWVRPDANAEDTRSDPIIWKVATDGLNHDTYGLAWGTWGGGQNRFALQMERASDDDDFHVASAIHSPGQWYHVAASYSPASDQMRIYVNGQREGTINVNNLVPYMGANSALRIGTTMHTDHGLHGSFDGLIDEVRVYNRQLTDGDVAALADWQPNTIPAPLALGGVIGVGLISLLRRQRM